MACVGLRDLRKSASLLQVNKLSPNLIASIPGRSCVFAERALDSFLFLMIPKLAFIGFVPYGTHHRRYASFLALQFIGLI